MRSKLKSNNAITGLGALCLCITSFTAQLILAPEGVHIMWLSPLGISTIAFFILGTYLIFLGIFKHELSFPEKEGTVKQRQEFMPQFRQVVDRMLTRMKELAIEAGRLPLEQYYAKYLKGSDIYKGEAVRSKVAIVVALYQKGLLYKNPYFYELEDKDTDMVSLKKEYASYLARISDKSLTNKLEQLFKKARMLYSVYTLAEMGKSKDFQFKDPKYINVFYEKPMKLESTVNYLHKSVNDRFDALLKGDDL